MIELAVRKKPTKKRVFIPNDCSQIGSTLTFVDVWPHQEVDWFIRYTPDGRKVVYGYQMRRPRET